MSLVYRVRLVVRVGEMSSIDRVGEMQFGGRMGGVMGMSLANWVRSAILVGEMQVSGRMGGVMRSVVLDSHLR